MYFRPRPRLPPARAAQARAPKQAAAQARAHNVAAISARGAHGARILRRRWQWEDGGREGAEATRRAGLRRVFRTAAEGDGRSGSDAQGAGSRARKNENP